MNVAEAVFRYQFDHNLSGLQRNVRYWFLRLGRSNPPKELLSRFTNEVPQVLEASMADISVERGVTRKGTDDRGVLFSISSIKLHDSETATVSGGYYVDGLSGSSNLYEARRQKGRWVVVKDTLRAIF